MSQKTNPALLGAFVLAGLGIALAAAFVLSSGNLFQKTYPYVMVFDGNVSGLNTGAPVQYRGVTIGSVREITLVVDREENIANVSVIVEIDPSLITFQGDQSYTQEISSEIEAGLRAQLEAQSLVTGLQKIMLVDRPDVPVEFRSILHTGLPEIPTIPNLSESLINDIRSLPLEEMVLEAHETLKNLNEMTTSLAEKETVATAQGTLISLQNLSDRLTEDLPQMTEDLSATLTVARSLMTDLEPAGKSLSKEMPGVLANLEDNMDSFFELQNTLNKTLHEIRTLLDRNSAGRHQLVDTLDTFTELAEKASRFLDYLERHPESLITGKPE